MSCKFLFSFPFSIKLFVGKIEKNFLSKFFGGKNENQKRFDIIIKDLLLDYLIQNFDHIYINFSYSLSKFMT